MRTKLTKYLLIAGLMLFMYGTAFSQGKPPKYLFKIATDLPENSSWVDNMKRINDEIYRETNGAVGVRVYAGGIMGDQSTVKKKIELGQLSGATFSSGGLSLIYKDFAVVGFPMVFRSYAEYDYFKEKMGGHFEKQFEKNGYVLLAWSEVGFIYLYSKYKVNSIDTLRKAKVWLAEGDEISYTFFKEVGCTPIPLQISDVLTGLQSGIIDTVFSSHYSLIILQWYTKVKYVANLPITLLTGAVMVDKKSFDSMPEIYQNKLKSKFKATFDNLNTTVRKQNAEALVSLKKYGFVVLDVSKKDTDMFYNVCDRIAMKLTDKEYSRDLYYTIVKYMKEFRNKGK